MENNRGLKVTVEKKFIVVFILFNQIYGVLRPFPVSHQICPLALQSHYHQSHSNPDLNDDLLWQPVPGFPDSILSHSQCTAFPSVAFQDLSTPILQLYTFLYHALVPFLLSHYLSHSAGFLSSSLFAYCQLPVPAHATEPLPKMPIHSASLTFLACKISQTLRDFFQSSSH